MQIKSYLCLSLAVAFLAGCASEKQTQAELQAQAKISRADAEKTALAQVPGGTVKDGELEKEKGQLIYSFDIATTGSKDVTEVAVDAITGKVLSAEKESAEQQSKEAAEDAAKAKKKQ